MITYLNTGYAGPKFSSMRVRPDTDMMCRVELTITSRDGSVASIVLDQHQVKHLAEKLLDFHRGNVGPSDEPVITGDSIA